MKPRLQEEGIHSRSLLVTLRHVPSTMKHPESVRYQLW